jgi:hypothetical protein
MTISRPSQIPGNDESQIDSILGYISRDRGQAMEDRTLLQLCVKSERLALTLRPIQIEEI